MGNCAAIQVGAYVDTCVGKPCSVACPTNPCANPGYVCNNGMCNQSIAPEADCTFLSNVCTPSCIDKASCQQCPSKPGCTYSQCNPECMSGMEFCENGVCKPIMITPPLPTGCNPPCGIGYTCYNKACSKDIPVDLCAGQSCSAKCPYGKCSITGQTCKGGECTVVDDACFGKECSSECPDGTCSITGQTCEGGTCFEPTVLPVYDRYGCNTSIGQTWCASTSRCHFESSDPCRPVVPIIPVEPIVVPPTGGCDGLNRDGNFDYTCLMEGQNSMMLILGIALLGGFVIMSGGK